MGQEAQGASNSPTATQWLQGGGCLSGCSTLLGSPAPLTSGPGLLCLDVLPRNPRTTSKEQSLGKEEREHGGVNSTTGSSGALLVTIIILAAALPRPPQAGDPEGFAGPWKSPGLVHLKFKGEPGLQGICGIHARREAWRQGPWDIFLDFRGKNLPKLLPLLWEGEFTCVLWPSGASCEVCGVAGPHPGHCNLGTQGSSSLGGLLSSSALARFACS